MADREDPSLLSQRPIPPAERLIFALDVPDRDTALRFVDRLGDSVRFYKVGLELAVTEHCFRLVDELLARGKQVFLDLKLHDVPETVGRAVRNLHGREGLFVTVHADDAALRAAVRERGGVKVIAVTVLTSLERQDLVDQGYPADLDLAAHVVARSRRALELGCDGVVASPLEAGRLRRELGAEFLILTPGIRPLEGRSPDDQKRIATPREAFLAGSDYVVVGRPIRDAAVPRAVAEKIQAEISELFAK